MGMAVWTESSARRVFPADPPPADAVEPSVRMRLARGESGSAQVVLRTPVDQPIRGVTVTATALRDPSGSSQIDADRIEWRQVGFVRVGVIHHPHRFGAQLLAQGWYPDPLLPVESFDVASGFTQPVWVTVHVPPDAPPGDYTGEVHITAHREPRVIVPLRVTVYAVTLPPGAGHLRTSFDLLEGFLEQNYGKPLRRDVSRRYGEFLLRHRLNPDDFSRSDPPDLDDLRHYREMGLNSFCVINLAKHRGQSIRGGLNSPPEWYTEANWDALAQRVDPFVSALRREPQLWPIAYVHGFDERYLHTHGDAIRLFFNRAKERWGLPTLTTSYLSADPAVLRGYGVDWLCPIFHPHYDFDKAEQMRAQGVKVWSYISLEPYHPYPNWRLDSPILEARTIWWQVFHQKMDGFLYWGLNIWDRPRNHEIVDPTRGPLVDFQICTGDDHDWLYGDGVLLYPGADGPIGSIRLANIRDGLQDYELLWLLKEAAGGWDEARAACLPVTTGLDGYTSDERVLEQQRLTILRRLASDIPDRKA